MNSIKEKLNLAGDGELFHSILEHELCPHDPATIRILDFGCGAGGTVKDFLDRVYDAYGCDLGIDWPVGVGEWHGTMPEIVWKSDLRGWLRPIRPTPYHLPFEAGTFDVVVSNQVFEHVRNKREAFSEIARVLKPNGLGIHMFPAKWFLPVETHIKVPFVSWMWPNVPIWWLALWAILGVRNEFQRGMKWRNVVAVNRDYCRDGLHYWRVHQFRALFAETFGDYSDLSLLKLRVGQNRTARLISHSPMAWLFAKLYGTFRQNCIGHHKRAPPELSRAKLS